MPEISVIIPVYNVENYLEKCMDSVCNQSFGDIEIICVNDGSTDGSLDILKEYGQKDNRIEIIDQKNQGLGAARNIGLKHANARYVCFLDSDDYLDTTTLEKLHFNASSNDSDMVLFKFQTFDDNENVHNRSVEFKIDEIFGDIDYSDFTFTYRDVKKHVMNTAFSACLKLYKKDFLDSFDDFHFPENLSFEDIPFHVKVMLRASRMSFVNESLYFYRSNQDSILNSTANASDIFENIDMVEDFLKEKGYYSELENEFIFFKIAQILLYRISKQPEDYFNRAREEFLKISIKDETKMKKYALNGYNRVINSPTYSDYISDYNKRKNKKSSSPKTSKFSKSLRFLKSLKF